MTLLQLVRAICGELGLGQPNAVASSTDQQVIQIYALLNKVGRNLVKDYEWQRLTKDLTKEYRFNTEVTSLTGTITSGSAIVTGLSDTTGLSTAYMATGEGIASDCYIDTVDSGTQVTLNQPATDSGSITIVFTKTQYTLPSDWDRQVDRTDWDKTNHWELIGPETAQQWQFLKSGIIATGPRIHYRLLGNKFQIWPPATSVSYVGFEYISKNWILATDGETYKSQFSVDSDTALFSDDLLIAGTKFEFFSAKGFDTTKLEQDFIDEVANEKGGDKPAKILSLAGSSNHQFIGYASIPDSGYGR
jgi:hypothetical protein